MVNGTVIHIMPASSRNTTRFMSFLEGMELQKRHSFIVYGARVERVPFDQVRFPVEFVKGGFFDYVKNRAKLYSADKIVVHGLFDARLILFLFFFRSLLSKCYWVVWGGDLYSLIGRPIKIKSRALRRFKLSVVEGINNAVTYIDGDVDLIRNFINKDVLMHECLVYPGNLFKEASQFSDRNSKRELVVMVGNSGSPSNNHQRVFERLSRNDSAAFKVVCPLSYGDPEYINSVCRSGDDYFGEKFVPVMEYMDMQDYIRFLSEVDYAVFDYDRQQGMGNIISLLGLGKGVFLNSKTTPWELFSGKGVQLLNVEDLEDYDFTKEFRSRNHEIIKSEFSRENLEAQIRKVFDS